MKQSSIDETKSPTFPVPTGRAASLLSTSEARLSDSIRRGRLNPAPPILAGRRLWYPAHLRQAAVVLEVMTPALDAILSQQLSCDDSANQEGGSNA